MPIGRIVRADDSDYPCNLKGLPGAPERLFVAGSILVTDKLAIGVVGSRKMTDYGKRMATYFSRVLAECGVTVISGLARGVDTQAHKAALNAGGRTIAVLGSGLDVVYPPENKGLFSKIIKNGSVITEFDYRTRPLAKNFLARNRIISGLSLGVLVVEGKRRSGTLSTAAYAANQGREVFAIPGPIDSQLSEAPNYLIANGAVPVRSPEEIIGFLKQKVDMGC